MTALLQVEDLNVWFDLPDGGELHAVQGVSVNDCWPAPGQPHQSRSWGVYKM